VQKSDVTASMQQATDADAPKTAKKVEEKDVGADDVSDSIMQAVQADAPKTAKAAEVNKFR